jgi:uncharacterized caspase-like protein
MTKFIIKHNILPYFFSLLLLVSLVIIMQSHTHASSERKWALIVGVNDYMNEVVPLQCAVNDAREIKKALIETSGFAEENVILLTTDQRGANNPTKENIAKCITDIKKKTNFEDTFVFFFSGHGMQMEDEGYLLTFEANPYSVETLEASCLEISKLKKWLDKMKSSRIILFADACREDPRSRGRGGNDVSGKGNSLLGIDDSKSSHSDSKSPENPLTESFSKGLVISAPAGATANDEFCFSASFFSCDIGQRSYEWDKNGMGFFTYYLVKGIRGDAGDEKGYVTIHDLSDYLGPKVSQAVEKEKNTKQNPRIVMQGSKTSGKWPISSLKPEQVAAARNYKPDVKVASLTMSSAKNSGSKSAAPLNITPKQKGSKIKYTLDIITNNVEGRVYDELTHRIQNNFYEIDRREIFWDVVHSFNKTGILDQIDEENEADAWIFFNVCPTEQMSIDIAIRDRQTGTFIYKENEELYRPYPGKKKQLMETAIRV